MKHYDKISDAQYNHDYVFFIERLLKNLGWETTKCAMADLVMKHPESGLTFSYWGYSGDGKWIDLMKDYETLQIGINCPIKPETTTKGILDTLAFYGKMSRQEIRMYQLITPWQDQVFFKNILRRN